MLHEQYTTGTSMHVTSSAEVLFVTPDVSDTKCMLLQ